MSEPIKEQDFVPLENVGNVPVEDYNDQGDDSVYKRGQQAKWHTRADDRESKRKREDASNEKDKRHKVTQFAPRLDEDGNPVPKSEDRRPKKKVACMVGYCGTGYQGMQINPDSRTIEGELFQAFAKAGAISQDNASDIKKNSFMRCARTDKGVHAAGNVISLKLIIEEKDILEKINSHLPDQIRVWGIERTNKGFDCRKMCSSRLYEYLIPTYSFLPPKPTTRLAQRVREANEKNPGVCREDTEGAEWWAAVHEKIIESGISEEQLKQTYEAIQESELMSETGEFTDLGKLVKSIKKIETEERRKFRISQPRLELVREALQRYKGHHNFHNFTVGKAFRDQSSGRFMKDLTISEPFVIEGTEWCSIHVHGQSFMLHQIRKMIAMIALIVRTGAPLDRINQAFTETKINVPKAPALGLLLENPVFDGYNKKLGTLGYKPIDFIDYQDKINDFKMKYIYDKIYADEVKENVFHGFFGFIDAFNGGSNFDFLTATYDPKKKVDAAEVIIPNEKNDAIEE